MLHFYDMSICLFMVMSTGIFLLQAHFYFSTHATILFEEWVASSRIRKIFILPILKL